MLTDSNYVLPVEEVIDDVNLLCFYTIETEDTDKVVYAALDTTIKNRLRSNSEKSCLYIYYGSAYTCSDCRRCGINTELQRVAMQSIQECFKDNSFIVFLYGQVNANTDSYGMVRVFARSIADEFPKQFNNEIVLHHLRCCAYKPDFDRDGKLTMFHDDEHKGRGNMVIYQV